MPSKDNNEIQVERLRAYTQEVALGIGLVMQHLSKRATGQPMEEELLRAMIESPYHDQFVAKAQESIVGAVALSITMGPIAGRVAYMHDLVSMPGTKGVGSALYDALVDRSRELSATKLIFTSKINRTVAHNFYSKRAIIKDSYAYEADI